VNKSIKKCVSRMYLQKRPPKKRPASFVTPSDMRMKNHMKKKMMKSRKRLLKMLESKKMRDHSQLSECMQAITDNMILKIIKMSWVELKFLLNLQLLQNLPEKRK
jgi:hypothetical protein